MKKILVFLCLTSLFFVSCKKDEPEVIKSKPELLTAHYWKMTALTVSPPLDFGGTQVSDLYAQFMPCAKDNINKYNSNGTTVLDEGATKCDPSDPQTENGVWAFNSTETIITEDGVSYNLVALSSNELKLSFQETDNGITYTYTGTWAKN